MLNYKITKFSSNKNKYSPNNTIAAIKCEGKPPLNIDDKEKNSYVKK